MGFFKDDSPAVLITQAQQSQADEMRARTKRYAWQMGLRTVCFLVAVALPVPIWAKVGCIIGAMILPWVAVTAANAGPVRKTNETASFDQGRVVSETLPLHLTGAKVIDGEVDRDAA